jgi:hypothetical protein
MLADQYGEEDLREKTKTYQTLERLHFQTSIHPRLELAH